MNEEFSYILTGSKKLSVLFDTLIISIYNVIVVLTKMSESMEEVS